jgi:transposase
MIIQTVLGPLEIDVEAFSLPPTFPIVLPVCRRLRLAEIVDRFCPMKNGDHLTHGQVVEFLVLHLLQAPHRSPLYKLSGWAEEHNIHHLYGRRAEEFNDDRVRRTLDALVGSLPEVETAVVTRALQEYRISPRAIHWDLTNVTFSGAHEDSDLVRSGYGQGRVHERQLQVSLHATAEGGVPVRHQTLPGNAHQAPLAEEMLQDLQQRLPHSDLIIVSDRAGISYDNILAYRRNRAHFLGPLQVTDPDHAAQLAAVPLEAFSPLSYRSMSQPDDAYFSYATTLQLKPEKRAVPLAVAALFVYSARKRRQDAQQREKKVERAWQRLEQIGSYLNKQRYARADYAREQLAKAVPRAVQTIVCYELSGSNGALSLRFWRDQEAEAQVAAGEGRYILVHGLAQTLTSDDIFTLYRRQGVIEARFRNFNSDLTVHPIWLQDDRRIQALLLVFILALIVYTLLELCAERAGLGTEHYHKMTTRAMIWTFGGVRLKQVRVAREPPQYELVMSADQEYILGQLGLPNPTVYLQPTI